MKTKTKNQNENPKLNRKLAYAMLAIVIVTVPLVYYYATSTTTPLPPRAAIIDQLASSKLSAATRHQNLTLIQSAETLLGQRFSSIDYYSDNATVEQYAKLASLGYRLIIWRGHSALDKSGYVALASTDKYGLKNYDGYLSNGQLAFCNVTGDPSLYFGITPKFIEQVMSGRFMDTVIFLMSCNGLNPDHLKTAQAFENKGAKVILSWDNWINPSDNDAAADDLLRYLISENNTVSQAVTRVPACSPEYGWATLRYYPIKAETSDYHIPDYRQPTAQAAANAALPLTQEQRRTKQIFRNAWIQGCSNV